MAVSEPKILMRPDQVEEAKDEIKRIEGMMSAPQFVRDQIQDRGSLLKQLNGLKKSLDTDAPKPFTTGEIDSAIAEERSLREKILEGMPTNQEMRHAEPGVIARHVKWEEANKDRILRWKNIMRRLEPDDPQASNLEKFRPRAGGEFSVNDGIVPHKIVSMGPGTPVPGSVATDAELDKLRELDSELADMFGVMNSDKRAKALEIVRGIMREDENDWRTWPWAKRKQHVKQVTGMGPRNMEHAVELMAAYEKQEA